MTSSVFAYSVDKHAFRHDAISVEFLSGPPGFQPFDSTCPVKRSRRHLPHWTQDGATYFVTFHLGDSLPQEKLRELRLLTSQLAQVEASSAEEYEERRREVMRKVESWLDAGYGNCWLARRDIASMMLNALPHFHGKRYDLGACCVMPNHLHAVFRPLPGHEMEEVMKSWKGFSSHEINKRLSMQGNVWIQESYDTVVRDARHLARVVQYIGNNPAKAGLAKDQWHRWENPEWARLGWGFREGG